MVNVHGRTSPQQPPDASRANQMCLNVTSSCKTRANKQLVFKPLSLVPSRRCVHCKSPSECNPIAEPETFHTSLPSSLAAYFLFCGTQVFNRVSSLLLKVSLPVVVMTVCDACNVCELSQGCSNFTHAHPSRWDRSVIRLETAMEYQEMIVQKTTFILPDFLTFFTFTLLQGTSVWAGFAVRLLTCERHRKLVDYKSELPGSNLPNKSLSFPCDSVGYFFGQSKVNRWDDQNIDRSIPERPPL